MHASLASTAAAAVVLGLGSHAATPARPARRSLLRLRGKVVYWHRVDGEPARWGVLRSDGRIKFHVHLSELLNSNVAPDVGQRVEFSPRPPRKAGELRRAVDVFVEKKKTVN
jgi:hypothetical protein